MDGRTRQVSHSRFHSSISRLHRSSAFSSFFLYISDLIDENYVIYTQHDEDGRFRVKLFCVNPAQNLQNCMDKGRSTVFFSAYDGMQALQQIRQNQIDLLVIDVMMPSLDGIHATMKIREESKVPVIIINYIF